MRALPLLTALLGALPTDPPAIEFPEELLSLRLPALEDLVREPTAANAGTWTGRLDGRHVRIALTFLDAEDWSFQEPEDVSELWRNSQRTVGGPFCSRHVVERYCPELRSADLAGSELVLAPPRVLTGSFGVTPLACFRRAEARNGQGEAGLVLTLAGLARRSGWLLELTCRPLPPSEVERQLTRALERAVHFRGALRDPRFTDAEARALWEGTTPERLHRALRPPVRSAHFLVLTNSSAGVRYARLLEQGYREFRALFPFAEEPQRRLLTVYLFRTQRDFVASSPHRRAATLRGHAGSSGIWTWYENATDRVHRHELAHQLAAARLRLGAGAWWFQEGLAEWFATRHYDRDPVARRVARARHVPFRAFLGGERAVEVGMTQEEIRTVYLQAAFLFEALRSCPRLAPRHAELLRRLGEAPRNAARARRVFEAALRDLHGLDLDGLEQVLRTYARTRR